MVFGERLKPGYQACCMPNQPWEDIVVDVHTAARILNLEIHEESAYQASDMAMGAFDRSLALVRILWGFSNLHLSLTNSLLNGSGNIPQGILLVDLDGHLVIAQRPQAQLDGVEHVVGAFSAPFRGTCKDTGHPVVLSISVKEVTNAASSSTLVWWAPRAKNVESAWRCG